MLKSDDGSAYPVVSGVPVIVEGVRVSPQSEPLSPQVIGELLDALMLPATRREAVEEVFSHKFTFREDWIQTEADQFLNRVAASHAGLRKALQLEEERPSNLDVNVAPTVALSCMFGPVAVRPASRFSMNMRLENLGGSTLSSTGAQPVLLAYHWIDANGVSIEGHRTPLLDDLLPGRSISIPVFFSTPEEEGKYTLSVRALQEGVAWLNPTVDFEVEVASSATSIDDPDWNRTGKHFEYMDDHFEAVRVLGEWRDQLFNRTVECVVELGGNANPMIDRFDAPRKFNVDIDPYGMIIGNMVRQDSGSSVEFIVADGMALPMASKSVDMLVMFATFHHFPDPIGLLSRLSEFVADDGLICLMCEPIGHVHRDTLPEEYLGEIRKGVNEQSFALWEYKQMFDKADLRVAAAQIDVGSAKIALRPRRGA